jgi:hypothetical protein
MPRTRKDDVPILLDKPEIEGAAPRSARTPCRSRPIDRTATRLRCSADCQSGSPRRSASRIWPALADRDSETGDVPATDPTQQFHRRPRRSVDGHVAVGKSVRERMADCLGGARPSSRSAIFSQLCRQDSDMPGLRRSAGSTPRPFGRWRRRHDGAPPGTAWARWRSFQRRTPRNAGHPKESTQRGQSPTRPGTTRRPCLERR